MIFTERTITVVNDSATINKPLILYRGDKNIELKITIAESQFKFRNTDASNVIETTDASYAQLVINTPYNSPIFSDVAATKNGAVIFVITEAMIDEIREVGAYEIQIRLLDDNKQSRASIPPVSNAIEIREPIAIEDGSAVDSNVVNVAKVNRALTTTSAPLEAFDSQGNYIKKTWGDGDPITDAALNKMEAGIDGVNKKTANISSQIKDIPNNIFKSIYECKDLHIWGHRCMQEVAPENTLIGVIKAKEYGLKCVEFDVYKTSDDILVVHHDDTVDRMTDGTGSISSMTLSQIKNLNIDTGNNIELYENLKIPTLEEMLIEVKKNDLFAMIHIYDGDANEVLRLINKYRLNMRVVISSYDTNLLKEIRALDPQIALSKIAGYNPSVDIPIAVELGNCMIGISWYAITTENVELAHNNNLLVVTDTCFDLNRYNEIKSKNIDMVLSDILL